MVSLVSLQRARSFLRPNLIALQRKLPHLYSNFNDILDSYSDELTRLRGSPELVDRLESLVAKYPGIELQMGLYQKLFPFPLDDFQSKGLESLIAGNNVIVMTPTGSGKTLVGELAIYFSLMMGLRVAYTTPLKALSNQKFSDFKKKFGADRVGLLTGDIAINRDAAVVIMTTEVLRNMIYNPESNAQLNNLFMVCFDEFHYMNDPDRGTVWEESVISCPPSVRILALSATMGNVEDIRGWMSSIHGTTDLVRSEFRPVPLRYFFSMKQGFFPLFRDPNAGPGALAGITRESQDKGGRLEAGSTLNPSIVRLEDQQTRRVQEANGKNSNGRRSQTRANPQALLPRYGDVVRELQTQSKLPAIFFIFSRSGCEQAAKEVLQSGLKLLRKGDVAQINEEIAKFIRNNPMIPVTKQSIIMLQSGVGVHHAGLIPVWKALIEDLFNANLVKVLFATETLAAGVNMPARATVITAVTKKINSQVIKLKTSQLLQMAGRAGRRGKDVEGSVVIMRNRFEDASMSHRILTATLDGVKSHFRTSYALTTKLLQRKSLPECRALIERGFGAYLMQQRIEKKASAGGTTDAAHEDEDIERHREVLQRYGLKEARDYIRLVRKIDRETTVLQDLLLDVDEQERELVDSLVDFMPMGTALRLRNGAHGYFLGDVVAKSNQMSGSGGAKDGSKGGVVEGFFVKNGRFSGQSSISNSGHSNGDNDSDKRDREPKTSTAKAIATAVAMLDARKNTGTARTAATRTPSSLQGYGIISRDGRTMYVAAKEHIRSFSANAESLQVHLAHQFLNVIPLLREWSTEESYVRPSSGHSDESYSNRNKSFNNREEALGSNRTSANVNTNGSIGDALRVAYYKTQPLYRASLLSETEDDHNRDYTAVWTSMQEEASTLAALEDTERHGAVQRQEAILQVLQEEYRQHPIVLDGAGDIVTAALQFAAAQKDPVQFVYARPKGQSEDKKKTLLKKKDDEVYAYKMFQAVIQALQYFDLLRPMNETHYEVQPLGEVVSELSADNELWMALLLTHPSVTGVISTEVERRNSTGVSKRTSHGARVSNLQRKKDRMDWLSEEEGEIEEEEGDSDESDVESSDAHAPVPKVAVIQDYTEFAALIAATMIDEFKAQNNYFKPPIPANVRDVIDALQPVLWDLKTKQLSLNLDFPLVFSPEITGLVQVWARGETSWRDLCALTGLDQGDLCRILRRTVEFLRQIPETRHLPDRVVMLAWQAAAALDRFPVSDAVEAVASSVDSTTNVNTTATGSAADAMDTTSGQGFGSVSSLLAASSYTFSALSGSDPAPQQEIARLLDDLLDSDLDDIVDVNNDFFGDDDSKKLKPKQKTKKTKKTKVDDKPSDRIAQNRETGNIGGMVSGGPTKDIQTLRDVDEGSTEDADKDEDKEGNVSHDLEGASFEDNDDIITEDEDEDEDEDEEDNIYEEDDDDTAYDEEIESEEYAEEDENALDEAEERAAADLYFQQLQQQQTNINSRRTSG